MRYYLDTEFSEDGRTIDLISIALVAEDGREFYMASTDFDPDKCNDWVRANVLPKLPERGVRFRRGHGHALVLGVWASRQKIREYILDFIGKDTAPVFWAYFADYDWVVLCQLFGAMVDLPKSWPMFCMDLKQYAIHVGVPGDLNALLPLAESDAHSALNDARWNAEVHNRLMDMYRADGLADSGR